MPLIPRSGASKTLSSLETKLVETNRVQPDNNLAATDKNADKLKNIDKGVDLLLTHLKNNSKIYVVVDCDNDGITSAAGLILYINNMVKKEEN